MNKFVLLGFTSEMIRTSKIPLWWCWSAIPCALFVASERNSPAPVFELVCSLCAHLRQCVCVCVCPVRPLRIPGNTSINSLCMAIDYMKGRFEWCVYSLSDVWGCCRLLIVPTGGESTHCMDIVWLVTWVNSSLVHCHLPFFMTLLSLHQILRASRMSVCECCVCSCVFCSEALFSVLIQRAAALWPGTLVRKCLFCFLHPVSLSSVNIVKCWWHCSNRRWPEGLLYNPNPRLHKYSFFCLELVFNCLFSAVFFVLIRYLDVRFWKRSNALWNYYYPLEWHCRFPIHKSRGLSKEKIKSLTESPPLCDSCLFGFPPAFDSCGFF